MHNVAVVEAAACAWVVVASAAAVEFAWRGPVSEALLLADPASGSEDLVSVGSVSLRAFVVPRYAAVRGVLADGQEAAGGSETGGQAFDLDGGGMGIGGGVAVDGDGAFQWPRPLSELVFMADTTTTASRGTDISG